ncbi:Coatomer subunit gamma-2 [Heterocephalus glaber]|uniref:Coatomer subunit gamma-2 n=1 Tax=Heterocephalus glaber TaxID=10181 RepID=G5ARP0_HETGA|nr:Coatomer subunit gamma-2 [Heterocephalus glaber]
MTGKEDVFQGPEMRALCRITDGTMLQAIERYMKQAIVDKVSSLAYCMLIRIASRLLKETEDGHESPLFDFIESWLRNKHEMVIYEAVSAIIHLPNCTARELAPAVSVLQLFCSSPKPALRYAAVRTSNKVAMKHLSAVTACNLDLQNLITDSNRSIATLAITTLLKTGSESSVDRLMKQISSFVSEISDEFKVVVVQNEAIRAAAVSALAKFGAQSESLLPSILVLLQRCMMGTDDEVWDRATFYLNVLQQRQMALNATYIFNDLTVSVPGMEKALHQYTLEPSEKPFDLKSIPLAMAPVFEQKAELTLVAPKPEKLAPSKQDIFQEQLAALPEFMNLGPLFKSSEPVQLTEAETEYFVRCIKHMFTNHIVFQFNCTNTLNDQLQEKVTVQMEPSDSFEVLCCIPAPNLTYNQPGICYTLVCLPDKDPTAVAGSFSCTMNLQSRTVTLTLEYQMRMELGDTFEKEETFALRSTKTLEEAVNNIITFLGMQPCESNVMLRSHRKGYGLILPKKTQQLHPVLQKPSVFGNDSHDDETSMSESVQREAAKKQAMKQTKLEMQKALAEDSTVYEYDSIYDKMQKKRESNPKLLLGKDRKYIHKDLSISTTY